MAAEVFNIPLSVSFADTLALKFLEKFNNDPLALSDVLFLVPNRRSVLTLKEAFLRAKGLSPFLLPRIMPIKDLDEDEIIFDQNQSLIENLPTEISAEERLLLFVKLIASKHGQYGIKEISLSKAFSLAADLAKLLDEVYNEELSFENLQNIVPEQYAAHWQETLAFLKIITAYWPDILRERHLIDQTERQNIMISKQADLWLQNPPKFKIVVAGVMPTTPVLKKIIKSIFEINTSEIYIYGADKNLSQEEYDILKEMHPQYEIKELLDLLHLNRKELKDIALSENILRENLISEMMRPAETTSSWRNLKKKKEKIEQGLKGIKIVECKDDFEEASSIALILREALETSQKTAALVTSDRNLARRVSSELKRFNITVDDTAGVPLHLTPIGVYLRQILDVITNEFSFSSVLALLKNPYMRLGQNVLLLRKKIRFSELQKRTPCFDSKENSELYNEIINEIKELFLPLTKLYQKPAVMLKEIMTEHIMLAEKLASNDESVGADILWRHEDGRMAASFLGNLLENADILDEIDPFEYLSVLTNLFSFKAVRPVFGTHPRLKILGFMEARFCKFDTVVLGSFNEGMCPPSIPTDPFLSHPMKQDFGLPLPEKMIGVYASDLSALLCSKEVYITRSNRSGGVPTSKSRYLLRLETILKACDLDIKKFRDQYYQKLAAWLNAPQSFEKIEIAAPKPPVFARPRKLSASAIEKLMRNPYEIYARYILKLRPLNDLEEMPDQSDFGTLVHKILEKFNNLYHAVFDQKALDVLYQIADKELEKYQLESDQKFLWKARLKNILDWFYETEKPYRSEISQIYTEVTGQMHFEAPAGLFTIEARADRIDEAIDGSYHIIDYKTGQIRSLKEIKNGYAPQLPIEALIAQSGGFKKGEIKLNPSKISALTYLKLGDRVVSYQENLDLFLKETMERLQKLINVFDFETTPYLARPNPKHLDQYADFEHLSRIKEWSVGEGDE